MFRQVIISFFLVSIAVGIAACGDTWRGVKQDTGDNLENSGRAMERAGDKVKP